MKLLPATAAEYALIRDLAHATWPDTFGNILRPAQIEYMLDMMYSEAAIRAQVAAGHVFAILLAAGASGAEEGYPGATRTRYAPVGYVSHQLDYLPGKTKVHKLYVLPAAQGRGYGKFMLTAVERTARAAGQTTLRLDVNYQNPALDFYRHLGFATVGRHDTDIGHGYLMEDYILEKPLT